MSLHKITAGHGYDYLTRQVAAMDAIDRGRAPLASYYTEKGETPGVWVGAGLVGIDGLAAGDLVTEAQMRALFATGLHPLADQLRADALAVGLPESTAEAATRLGTPFQVREPGVNPFRVELARRYAAANTAAGRVASAPLDPDSRARIRTDVAREFFAREQGRAPVDVRELHAAVIRWSRPTSATVAGYDLTFSPVKSVSALWALADPATAALIEQAHNAAVADALRFIETHALFTRTGAHGIRQVNVRGLVGTAFTHRDSRAGDPDLHTHVAVANKVQTVEGRWLAIDGRLLYKANVAASETYNTALEAHLVKTLGVRFVDRVDPRGKRPVREIARIHPRLIAAWSSRRTSIDERRTALAATFLADHGRPPTDVEMIALAQQATLETRDPKHAPRTLTNQRRTWRAQADALLGADSVNQMLTDTLSTPHRAAGLPGPDWWPATAARIVTALERDRSTWQTWHVRAEALRQVRPLALSPDLAEVAVTALVGLALDQQSIRLTREDPLTEPAGLRRADGASVYTVAGDTLYTSARILAAEQRLLTAAGRRDGRMVDPRLVDVALLEALANDTPLNAGQTVLVRDMATSGCRVQLAIAPAGSGKTTAMRALASCWRDSGGSIVGLAPSAAAAAVLADQLDIPCDTLAKLTWSLTHPDQPQPNWVTSIGPDTLVIIDEAGLADTLTLDDTVQHVLSRGGSVRLVGDDQQLTAVGAGGVLRDIHTEHGACRLTEVLRFTDPAEAAASLALREGRPEALGFYLDHHRIHVGDHTLLTDHLLRAWASDQRAGLDAIMLAPTRDQVTALNQAAQHHQHTRTPTGTTVRLGDGSVAAVGDLIITRRNNRHLRAPGNQWVKNGDRWHIDTVHPDGSLDVRHVRGGHRLRLPADYVAAWVDLGYATTIHGAQGVTADTMHGYTTGTETCQQLYTMLTRGRHANHLYLQVTNDGDPSGLHDTHTVRPPTPTEILESILTRDDTPTSATTQLRHEADPARLLAPAAARYHDALRVAAEHTTAAATIRALEDAAAIQPSLADWPAWPTLRADLILLAANGLNPTTTLHTTLAADTLNTAHDPAAVLDWRIQHHLQRIVPDGPLPWLPGIPHTIANHPTWGPYLTARATHIRDLAHDIRTHATDVPQPWLAETLHHLDQNLIGDIALWRAATGVKPTDLRPTGQPRDGAEHTWKQRLDSRLEQAGHTAIGIWGPILHQHAPTAARDPQVALLADTLEQLRHNGADAQHALTTALATGPLPDDHPAAALLWRLTRIERPDQPRSTPLWEVVKHRPMTARDIERRHPPTPTPGRSPGISF